LKAKSSDTDDSGSEDSSSDSSFNSSRAEKIAKSPVSRFKTSSEVKANAKLPKSMHKETKKSKYSMKQQAKQVVDFLDVSALSLGDELEAEKTGFDSKSFVDDLLSGDQETIRKNLSKSPDTDFGDFFNKPSIVESLTESPPKPSIKPKTNDIMGLFKMESPAQVDIFSSAGPRAQEMRPIMRPQGPPLHTRTQQTAMTQNLQIGYPSVRSQPVLNRNVFNQVTNSQTNPSQRFSNPKPQSSAFDALMRGNVPIKSQPPSARSLTSSYVPSKPAGPSLDIDLTGWMN